MFWRWVAIYFGIALLFFFGFAWRNRDRRPAAERALDTQETDAPGVNGVMVVIAAGYWPLVIVAMIVWVAVKVLERMGWREAAEPL